MVVAFYDGPPALQETESLLGREGRPIFFGHRSRENHKALTLQMLGEIIPMIIIITHGR